MENDGRSIIERYWRAFEKSDFAAMAQTYAEAAVQEWPQSGERVAGRANIMAINESYPGLPVATVRSINGRGGLWVSEVTLNYGGDRYECVSILQTRDSKIVHESDYFAAPFHPPACRAHWTHELLLHELLKAVDPGCRGLGVGPRVPRLHRRPRRTAPHPR